MKEYIVRDRSLWQDGRRKIEWVQKNMPLLNTLEKDFSKNQYFKGQRIVVSIHLEAKTAYLAKILAAGGAEVFITGSNPLSTQDDIAAALVEDGLHVYAWYNATVDDYFSHLNAALDGKPTIVIDDGGDIVQLLHSDRSDLSANVIGGSEETTTGVLRLRARERENALKFPMIAVNDAYCKYLFDNRYGTGQSVWTGINKTTNLIVAGKNIVVAGYGWCGKGIARRAQGLGARVIICEIDPIKSVEAIMDGYQVMTMDEASCLGDVFITVTGCKHVIYQKHFLNMKDGAIMCNAGHFDVEICLPELTAISKEQKNMRQNIEGYCVNGEKWLYVLAEGRLVNLAAGDGHPAEIMDMSFALQALSAKYLMENASKLDAKVYNLPDSIDKYVAELKLHSMGVTIDKLTEDQVNYLNGWGE